MNARPTPRRGFQVPEGVTVGERLRRDMDAMLRKVRLTLDECDRGDAKRMELDMLGPLVTKMMNEGRGAVAGGASDSRNYRADARSLVLESVSPAPARPRLFAFGVIRRRVRAATHRNGGAA